MAAHHHLLELDPKYRQRLMALENTTRKKFMTGAAMREGITTIPIVVHVVYNTPEENISAAQVRSQIPVLNKDYNLKNSDLKKVPACWKGLVTDARIKFVLAKKDPDGKKTTGITRTKTDRTSFDYISNYVKSAANGGKDPWPTDKYLNIWVCTLSENTLGYAQFPEGPAETDGVVILNTGFGTKGTASAPFDKGRTAVHEIGHWLNLHHIWGDDWPQNCTDSDLVDDTPNQLGPNYGKPTFPSVSCQNGPNGDMFMNYMDYVDDDSMYMFTTQQVARMQATLDAARSSLGT